MLASRHPLAYPLRHSIPAPLKWAHDHRRRGGDLDPQALEPDRDTFPKLVSRNAGHLGHKVAIREKDYGIWQSYTWREYFAEARLIALRLAALGFTRGDKTAIIGDPRGMRGYSEPFLMSLAELQELGKKFEVGHPTYFDDELARGKPDDVAIICYTSGTTGVPKGAMLSHRNLIVTARNAAEFEGLQGDEQILSYLPMAWVGDHIFSYAQSIVTGFAINCPESAATVLHDLKEIGPTYFFAPPRIWENILTNVMVRLEDCAC